MKTPRAVAIDLRLRIKAAVRRIERPAGIDAPAQQRIHRERRADDIDIPAHQVQSREGQVFRADHQRHEKISKRRGYGRNQEEKDHDDAVRRKQLVVRVRLNERAARLDQMQPHQHGEYAADEKHHRDRSKIEQRDPLVIGRQKPRFDAVARVQIIDTRFRRRFHNCRAHFPFFLSSVPSDFTYAINCNTCSSFTCP